MRRPVDAGSPVPGWSQAGKKWGDLSRAGKPVRARLLTGEFDWEDDVRPEIPYSDSIIYRLHVRGFTKHRSSGVKDRGTFGGIREKIPYLKELGVTAVELLPVTEFDEVMVTEPAAGLPDRSRRPQGGSTTGDTAHRSFMH